MASKKKTKSKAVSDAGAPPDESAVREMPSLICVSTIAC